MDLYQKVLGDASFYVLLAKIDRDLAQSARGLGCDCGGALHSARYRRKARGGPPVADATCRRESLCCAVAGCRKRTTPASVQFLGRKVFFGVVVLLIPILREGLTPKRFARLAEELPVSRRTVQRWRHFWRDSFVESRRWQQGRADVPLASSDELPGSLLDAFMGTARDRVLGALRWLASAAPGEHDL